MTLLGIPICPTNKGIIITYGDTIYSKFDISPDLVVHEITHVQQQEVLWRDNWWDRYFEDTAFRLEQELEAYRNQYSFIKQNFSRPVRKTMLRQIANIMSTLYGGMCTYDEAIEFLNPTT